MPKPAPRLTPADWLDAGLAALCEAGPDALKAEPLARRLGTTKGSFYWHFKDVPDFHARLVRHWEQAALSLLSCAAEASTTPADRLKQIAKLIPTVPNGIEPAIRAWARGNPEVAAALEEIDTARLAYLSAVLNALGLTNPDFPRLAYGAVIGLAALPDTGPDDTLSTLTAAFLALQDS